MNIRDEIRKMIQRPGYDKKSDREVAVRILEMCNEYEWREIAEDLMTSVVWAVRRAEVRNSEERALTQLRTTTPLSPTWARTKSQRAEIDEFLGVDADNLSPLEAGKERRRRMREINFDRSLLEKMFAVGDGSRVKWGDATLVDHANRIETLTKQRDGLNDTIELHERAMSIIQSTGKMTLREALDGDIPLDKTG